MLNRIAPTFQASLVRTHNIKKNTEDTCQVGIILPDGKTLRTSFTDYFSEVEAIHEEKRNTILKAVFGEAVQQSEMGKYRELETLLTTTKSTAERMLFLRSLANQRIRDLFKFGDSTLIRRGEALPESMLFQEAYLDQIGRNASDRNKLKYTEDQLKALTLTKNALIYAGELGSTESIALLIDGCLYGFFDNIAFAINGLELSALYNTQSRLYEAAFEKTQSALAIPPENATNDQKQQASLATRVKKTLTIPNFAPTDVITENNHQQKNAEKYFWTLLTVEPKQQQQLADIFHRSLKQVDLERTKLPAASNDSIGKFHHRMEIREKEVIDMPTVRALRKIRPLLRLLQLLAIHTFNVANHQRLKMHEQLEKLKTAEKDLDTALLNKQHYGENANSGLLGTGKTYGTLATQATNELDDIIQSKDFINTIGTIEQYSGSEARPKNYYTNESAQRVKRFESKLTKNNPMATVIKICWEIIQNTLQIHGQEDDKLLKLITDTLYAFRCELHKMSQQELKNFEPILKRQPALLTLLNIYNSVFTADNKAYEAKTKVIAAEKFHKMLASGQLYNNWNTDATVKGAINLPEHMELVKGHPVVLNRSEEAQKEDPLVSLLNNHFLRTYLVMNYELDTPRSEVDRKRLADRISVILFQMDQSKLAQALTGAEQQLYDYLSLSRILLIGSSELALLGVQDRTVNPLLSLGCTLTQECQTESSRIRHANYQIDASELQPLFQQLKAMTSGTFFAHRVETFSAQIRKPALVNLYIANPANENEQPLDQNSEPNSESSHHSSNSIFSQEITDNLNRANTPPQDPQVNNIDSGDDSPKNRTFLTRTGSPSLYAGNNNNDPSQQVVEAISNNI